MNPSVTAQMRAHLAGKRTTLARAYKVTRRDGQVFGFTSHQRDITIDGVRYLAASGLAGSALQQHASMAADNMEVQGAIVSSLITEEDIYAGLWSYAEVEMFDFNYRDLSMGRIRYPGVRLGEIRTGRGLFQAEAWGLSKLLQQNIGRIYRPLCDADLGDARCGIDLATLPDGIVSASVTAVTDRRIFTASALATPADWSTGGKVTWTSGRSAGLSMPVRTHGAGGVITLALPMFYPIEVADTFDITAGCQKRAKEDCRDKFHNIVNHRGFDLMPGTDRLATGK